VSSCLRGIEEVVMGGMVEGEGGGRSIYTSL
jgi:hypothetical protein